MLPELQALWPGYNINEINTLVVLFAIYSFFGWIIEVLYRSYTHGHFVNAGFLIGPFVIVYGAGAVLCLCVDSMLPNIPLMYRAAVMFFMLSALEYLVGVICEKVFGLKLWDYSSNRFNVHGRVCLLFSCAWTVLALAFTEVIHPAVLEKMKGLTNDDMKYMAVSFLFYFTTDFSASIVYARSFRQKLRYLLSDYLSLNSADLEKLFYSVRRILRAFPHVNTYLDLNLRETLKHALSGFINSIGHKVSRIVEERRVEEKEFYSLVEDILASDELTGLMQYKYHNKSLYDHAIGVSYLSYRISKYLNMDFRSCSRGALLYHLCYYLMRIKNEKKPPRHLNMSYCLLSYSDKIADIFQLNDVEIDIITRAAWPFSISPPRFRETFAVIFADRYLNSQEFLAGLARYITER